MSRRHTLYITLQYLTTIGGKNKYVGQSHPEQKCVYLTLLSSIGVCG